MSLEDRLVWDEPLELPDISARTFDELLYDLGIEDSPEGVQIRVVTAIASKLSLGLEAEAVARGILPPTVPPA